MKILVDSRNDIDLNKERSNNERARKFAATAIRELFEKCCFANSIDTRTRLANEYEQVQKQKLATTIDRVRFREEFRPDFIRSAKKPLTHRVRALNGPLQPPLLWFAVSGLPRCLPTVVPDCNGFFLQRLLMNMQYFQPYSENGLCLKNTTFVGRRFNRRRKMSLLAVF